MATNLIAKIQKGVEFIVDRAIDPAAVGIGEKVTKFFTDQYRTVSQAGENRTQEVTWSRVFRNFKDSSDFASTAINQTNGPKKEVTGEICMTFGVNKNLEGTALPQAYLKNLAHLVEHPEEFNCSPEMLADQMEYAAEKALESAREGAVDPAQLVDENGATHWDQIEAYLSVGYSRLGVSRNEQLFYDIARERLEFWSHEIGRPGEDPEPWARRLEQGVGLAIDTAEKAGIPESEYLPDLKNILIVGYTHLAEILWNEAKQAISEFDLVKAARLMSKAEALIQKGMAVGRAESAGELLETFYGVTSPSELATL